MFECTLLALALAQGSDIKGEDIFPENSFFVAEVQDVEGFIKRVDESPIWKMTGQGSVEDALAPMFAEMAGRMNLTEEQVGLPTELGFSVYMGFDEDLGIDVPAYMAYFNFGTHEKMAQAVFENILEELSQDARSKFDEEEMRGRDMLVIESEMEMPDLGEAMGQMDMIIPIGGDLDGMMEPLSTVYIIQDGARLLVGSDPVGLDDAISVIDGGKAKVLASSNDYQALREMIPPEGRDMTAMLLTENLQTMVAPAIAGPMTAGLIPLIQELFGDIRGYGFWADGFRSSNIVEYGVSMRIEGERRGLIKLLDLSRPAGEIPGYVPAEAMSYGRVDFDFKNLVPTVRQIIRTLPEAQGQQVEPMFEQFAPMLQSGLETLGPEVHVFTVPTDNPFEPSRTTIAIPTADSEALEQLFAMMAPAAGLMPRDFNGNTIYSDPLDEFSQMAIGIGAGSLIVGQSAGVEAVLRSAGQKDLPSMERSDSARTVQRALPSGGLMGWGVIDMAKQIEAQQGMAAMMPMLLGQAGVDPGMMQDQMERIMEMDAEKMREMVGPGWWYMKSDDRGVVFHGGIMAPPGSS